MQLRETPPTNTKSKDLGQKNVRHIIKQRLGTPTARQPGEICVSRPRLWHMPLPHIPHTSKAMARAKPTAS